MADERRESSEQNQGSKFQRGNHRYIPRPKYCQFCSDKTQEIDYKIGRAHV